MILGRLFKDGSATHPCAPHVSMTSLISIHIFWILRIWVVTLLMRARALVKGQAPLHAPIAMQLVPDHWRHHFAPCFIFGFIAAILLGTPSTVVFVWLLALWRWNSKASLRVTRRSLCGSPTRRRWHSITACRCWVLRWIASSMILRTWWRPPYNRHIPPPINELHSHWRAWDEEISPQFRFHLLVTYCNLGTWGAHVANGGAVAQACSSMAELVRLVVLWVWFFLV